MAETVGFVKMLDENEFEMEDPTKAKNKRKFQITKMDIVRVLIHVALVMLFSFIVSYITTVVMHSGERKDQTANRYQNPSSYRDLKGDTGVEGDKGMSGEKGLPGESGQRGGKGPTGERGPIGTKGVVGDKGVKGEKGHQGNRGVAGEKGPRGEKGLKGATGLTGLKGAAGDRGLIGSTGIKGDQGLTGERGPIGKIGLQGNKGSTGDKGIVGDQGPRGDKGVAGDKGLDGDKGPIGDKGSAGAEGQIGDKGPAGDKGSRGDKGLTGDKGPVGGAGAVSCEPGWIPYHTSCYLFVFNAKKSWEDAKNDCAKKKGWLVKIENIVENWFIKSMLKEKNAGHAWMGLHDATREGHFIWASDGTTVSFTNWGGKNPDNWGNGEDCVHYSRSEYKWNDIKCSNKFGYICEKQ